MSDENVEISAVTPSIKSAMRRARIEEAERSDVIAELRGAELARLEMLAEKLEPLYAQIPDDIDIFDAGVMPGDHPRLFIDMIGFVDMGPDKRTYRFVQDTRHGRVVMKESERAETMVEAIADYVGRRLLERERALASDRTLEEAARALTAQPKGAGKSDAASSALTNQGASGDQTSDRRPARKAGAAAESASIGPATQSVKPAPDPIPAPRRSSFAWLWDTIEFLALFIGFVVMLIGLAGAVYFVWHLGDANPLWKFFKTGS